MSLDLKFQPEQKYDYMSDQELADLWRTMPLNNPQRYFIYKELKARNNSEALVSKNYASYFSLPEDETVILRYDENIVLSALRCYLGLLCMAPTLIPGAYLLVVEKILQRNVDFVAVFGFRMQYLLLIQLAFLLLPLMKIISADMVLTCRRLIIYVSFFDDTKRFSYSFHDFSNNALLVCIRDYFRQGSPFNRYIFVDILNLKQGVTSMYSMKLKKGPAFLESVLGIAQENGCPMYIAPIVIQHAPSSTGKKEEVLYRFNDCTPEYLAKWFTELAASGVSSAMNPRYTYLADIAKYFAAAGPAHKSKGLSSEAGAADETYITTLKDHYLCRFIAGHKYVVLTDKQMYLQDSKKKTIGAMQYSNARVTMSGELIELSIVKGRTFRVRFYFSGTRPVLPVLDLYQLLGVSIKIKEVAA